MNLAELCASKLPYITFGLVKNQQLSDNGQKVEEFLFLAGNCVLLLDAKMHAQHLQLQLPVHQIHGRADNAKFAKLLRNPKIDCSKICMRAAHNKLDSTHS